MGNGASTGSNSAGRGPHFPQIPGAGRSHRSPNSSIRNFGRKVIHELTPLKTVSPTNVSVKRHVSDSDLPLHAASSTELHLTGATGPFANRINGLYEHDDVRRGFYGNSCNGKKIYYRCNNQLSPSKKNQGSTIIRYNRLGHWEVLQTMSDDKQLVLARTADSKLPDPENATEWFVRKRLIPPSQTRRGSMREFLDSVT